MSPDKTNLSGQMQNVAQRTDITLSRLFDAEKAKGAAPRLVDAMAYSTLNGGKRVRAFLVVATAAMLLENADIKPNANISEANILNANDQTGLWQVAAAFECLHAYSLIHDDLPAMDDAATRRGRPACHLAFDEATAILAGDALQSLAFQLLAAPSTHPDPGIRAALVLNLAEAAGDAGMAGGQMFDLEAENRVLDRQETAVMQAMKTGALITSSVRAGGQYAGAEAGAGAGAGADVMIHLEHYGKAIGQAFQIADDLLDAEGDESIVGKPLGQDDWRGKSTLVAHLGIDGARLEAKNQVDMARQALAQISAKSPSWQADLDSMAQYIITRNA